MDSSDVLFDGDTEFGHYQVVDTIYAGRAARVLYSGNHRAAQSGIARDGQPELLFDYNRRFMELVRGMNPARVLLLGGGAFTLPKALMDEFPAMQIDVVELDEGLVKLARQYFGFTPNKHVRVYVSDGRTYLANHPTTYDVILVDVFEHATVPLDMQTVEAAHALSEHLKPEGAVAMNIIAAYQGERSLTLRRQIAAFEAAFEQLDMAPATSSLSPWTSQNFILIAQKGRGDLATYLRHAALALPDVDSSAAVHDANINQAPAAGV